MILNKLIKKNKKKNTFTKGPLTDSYLDLSTSSHSHQMGSTQLITQLVDEDCEVLLKSQSVVLGLYEKNYCFVALFLFIYCTYLLTSCVKLGQELALKVEK